MRVTISDRKLNPPQFIQARKVYLPCEREFRRRCEVIVQKPADYDDSHEEIWNLLDVNGNEITEIWDAAREFNLDEVPFIMDIRTKQIVAIGERASVFKNKYKYGKYRQGTLVVVSNFKKILFLMIIFNKGEKGVRKILNTQMHGTFSSKVHWQCSASGSMTKYIWKKTMNIFKNRTRILRRVTKFDGSDWTQAVILNVDNFGVHLETKTAEKFAKSGIFIRCLLRNASHIQQPVDQHLGILLKNIIKERFELWMMNNDELRTFGVELGIDMPKWRQFIARFTDEAVTELHKPKYKHVFAASWINYGIYLLLNNSEDGDISTLHVANKHETQEMRNTRTEELIKKVTIQKRENGTNPRILTQPQNINYCIESANTNSLVATRRCDKKLNMLKLDLRALYQEELNIYLQMFHKDLTNRKNKLPMSTQLIGPYDVIILEKFYTKYHEYPTAAIRRLYLNELGLPLRDERGAVIEKPIIGKLNFYCINLNFYCINLNL